MKNIILKQLQYESGTQNTSFMSVGWFVWGGGMGGWSVFFVFFLNDIVSGVCVQHRVKHFTNGQDVMCMCSYQCVAWASEHYVLFMTPIWSILKVKAMLVLAGYLTAENDR